jgi:diguanylate cyclase (GGDEF)-like protein
MLARARRQHSQAAILFLDIDGFKYVNDTFGHANGDRLLQSVAARLSSVVRDGDTVGRLGGDEFVVLLDSPGVEVSPELVAERVLAVLRQPIDLNESGGRTLTITASIGIAAGSRATADDFLRDANIALYAAKEAGRDRYQQFESGMQAVAEDHLNLETDLRAAVVGDQFFLVSQPTFDLQSKQVTGVEALIRWQHPQRGIITPDLFIPLTERNGMILPIGRWVRRSMPTSLGLAPAGTHDRDLRQRLRPPTRQRQHRRRCARSTSDKRSQPSHPNTGDHRNRTHARHRQGRDRPGRDQDARCADRDR